MFFHYPFSHISSVRPEVLSHFRIVCHPIHPHPTPRAHTHTVTNTLHLPQPPKKLLQFTLKMSSANVSGENRTCSRAREAVGRVKSLFAAGAALQAAVGEEDAQICFHTARSASERKTAMSDLPSSRHRQQSSSYPLIRTPLLARTRFVKKRHRSARLRIAEVMSHQMQVLGVFWGLFRCGTELARLSPPAVIICCRLHAVTLLWRSARELWPSG